MESLQLFLSDSGEDMFESGKWFIFTVLNFHYLLFAIGSIVRRGQHSGDGLISVKESKPVAFKVKCALQIIMVFATWMMAYDIDCEGNFEPLALIYIVYGFIWLISIYLQVFEYRRNIPHVWYAHQSFWLLSTLLNIAILTFMLLGLDLLSYLQRNKSMSIKYIVCHTIYITVSFVLAYMSFRYNND